MSGSCGSSLLLQRISRLHAIPPGKKLHAIQSKFLFLEAHSSHQINIPLVRRRLYTGISSLQIIIAALSSLLFERSQNGNITSLLSLTKNSILPQALTQRTDRNNINKVSAQSASISMRTINVLNEQMGDRGVPGYLNKDHIPCHRCIQAIRRTLTMANQTSWNNY